MEGGLSGNGAEVLAFGSHHGELFVGGNFDSAGTTNARSLASWNLDDGGWTSYGSQGHGRIMSMAFDQDDVFIGGRFQRTPDHSSIQYLARYNLATDTYSAVGSPIEYSTSIRVSSVLVHDGFLYAGGLAWDGVEGDDSMRNFARINLDTMEWEAINTIGSPMYNFLGLGLMNDKVLVWGRIGDMNRISYRHTFFYDPETGTTKALGQGLTQDGHGISYGDEKLFVTGTFNGTGDYRANKFGVMSSPYRTWEHVDFTVPGGNGNPTVSVLADRTLFMGGSFSFTSSSPDNYLIAHDLDTKEWFPILNEDQILGGPVNDLLLDGDDLYIAGQLYLQNFEFDSPRIIRYHIPTETFHPVGNIIEDTDTNVRQITSLFKHEGYIYAGGSVLVDFNSPTRNFVGRYDIENDTWDKIAPDTDNGIIRTVYVFEDYLYAGGSFTNFAATGGVTLYAKT